MKKFVVLALFVVGTMSVYFYADLDDNRHQFKLDFKTSGQITVVCDNCFHYYNNYDFLSHKTVVNREIDGKAIELFSSIKFCGMGDTTPDGTLQIVTDTGSVAAIGVIFPNQELNQTLRIQTAQTGLGSGCTRRHQENFEEFFHTYAGQTNL